MIFRATNLFCVVFSYDITPRKPKAVSTAENYNIADLHSDDETDDEDDPRKVIPQWAQGKSLNYIPDVICTPTPFE